MPVPPEPDPDFSYHRSAADTEAERVARMARRLAGGKQHKTTWSTRAVEANAEYAEADLGDPAQ